MTERDEDGLLLAQMLELADRLTATGDALLSGQYAYLRARIAALMEVRAFGEAGAA